MKENPCISDQLRDRKKNSCLASPFSGKGSRPTQPRSRGSYPSDSFGPRVEDISTEYFVLAVSSRPEGIHSIASRMGPVWDSGWQLVFCSRARLASLGLTTPAGSADGRPLGMKS